MTRIYFNRRSFLGATGAMMAALGAGIFPSSLSAQSMEPDTNIDVGEGPFSLPRLPYSYDALEPAIDAETMRTHYSKHHAAYVRNLNKAVRDAGIEASGDALDLIKKIRKLPKDAQKAVRNNGGGHVNHTLFWSILSPNAGSKPTGELAKAIERDIGGLDALKAELKSAGSGVFGSGWAWLVVGKNGRLAVTSTANQDNPLMDVSDAEGTPILGIDVWEHAYYLKYKNDRGKYLDNIWSIISWEAVAEHAAKAGLKGR